MTDLVLLSCNLFSLVVSSMSNIIKVVGLFFKLATHACKWRP